MKLLAVLTLLLALPIASGSVLKPLKLDHPRDTMRTYMEAMNDYAEGVNENDDAKIARLNDAIRTLNLEGTPFIQREEKGRRAAQLLKEIIDRVIVIDLERVPDDKQYGKWRLKDTNFNIAPVESGDNKGDYLFTPSTVERLENDYKKVKHLPYLEGTTGGAFYEEPWDEKYIPEWGKRSALGLQKWQWIGLFVVILLGFIVKALTELLVRIIKSMTSKREDSTRHQIILALEKPIGMVVAAALWFFSVYFMRFTGLAEKILLVIVQVVFSYSAIWACYRLSDVITLKVEVLAKKTESELDDQLVPLLSKALRVFVIVVGVLVTIQNLGFNVMSLVAGLGLGGLAFALAAKDTAANLFGSIMILLDRPFKPGDWIISSGVEGTVVEIGFRSTRLRTFYDSLITVPNSVLANAHIDNMGQRKYRRIKSYLGLTYDTPPEKVEAFVQAVRQVILDNPHTRKDYFHVYFNGYGDSSLNILLYCFLEVPDWAKELEEKQNLLLEIYKAAEKTGVEFAFPTQTLHIESLPGATANP